MQSHRQYSRVSTAVPTRENSSTHTRVLEFSHNSFFSGLRRFDLQNCGRLTIQHGWLVGLPL